MFSKKTKTQQTENSTMTSKASQPDSSNQGISILAEGCHFQGKMFLRGTARIAGIVDGTIASNHVLIIEPTAKVTGQVSGVKILVCGQIDGRISASELVHLTETAKVDGDLQSPRFIVDDGAMLKGQFETSPLLTSKNNSQPASPVLKKAG